MGPKMHVWLMGGHSDAVYVKILYVYAVKTHTEHPKLQIQAVFYRLDMSEKGYV